MQTAGKTFQNIGASRGCNQRRLRVHIAAAQRRPVGAMLNPSALFSKGHNCQHDGSPSWRCGRMARAQGDPKHQHASFRRGSECALISNPRQRGEINFDPPQTIPPPGALRGSSGRSSSSIRGLLDQTRRKERRRWGDRALAFAGGPSERINDRYGRCSIGLGLFPQHVRAFKGHAAFPGAREVGLLSAASAW
jgi:hypothetical protein